jgi:hypothetical protein
VVAQRRGIGGYLRGRLSLVDAGAKQIGVWPYNQHNGGETFQTRDKIRFLKDRLG